MLRSTPGSLQQLRRPDMRAAAPPPPGPMVVAASGGGGVRSSACRRMRRSVQYGQRQETWLAQQEQALDAEEDALLARQVYLQCLVREVTADAVTTELSRFGAVQQVQLQRPRGKVGKPPPLPRAVVEFKEAAAAAQLLASRIQVGIFAARHGAHATTNTQLVLPAGSIGHLKEPCSCRRYRRPCTCPGFVRAQPNRPPAKQAWHRGDAGEHELTAMQLQAGSPGPDGSTIITELQLHTSCRLTVDLRQRCLTISAPLGEEEGDDVFDFPQLLWDAPPVQHMLVFKFRDLRRSLVVDAHGQRITWSTRQPPKVLSQVCDLCRMLLGEPADGPEWQLALDPTSPAGAATSVGSGLAGAHGVLGRCTWYSVTLTAAAGEDALTPGSKLLKKLDSFNLLAPSQGVQVVSRRSWEAAQGRCRLPDMLSQLDFLVGYHVQLLISSGVVSVWQASEPAVQQLLQQATPSLACRALVELASSSMAIRNLPAALEQHLEGLAAQPALERSAQLCSVLHAHVTITRLKYQRPEPESGNRVIRHFSNPSAVSSASYSRSSPHNLACLSGLVISDSHFLRLSFGDEHGDKLFDSRDEPVEAFWSLMRSTLAHGVSVNGRHFAFLAFSSSQLKSWSCWMVADPLHGQPGAVGAEALAQALRWWMGDAMDNIKVPAKCAARLGQCFSTTIDAAVVARHEVEKIADIERNGFCFSDGVGRISPALLDEVLLSLPFAPAANVPVKAIQIRFGGAKGVVSRCSQLAMRSLQLRPSQIKFTSSHPQLEVCAVATWLPAYLNRQVIIMMEHNGVPAQAFLSKLEACLDDLAAMCSGTAQALQVLPSLGGIEPGMHTRMLHMLAVCEACHVPMGPLLDSCLNAIARWQVTDLRTKARLLVRDGATLMGVMDEFGVLQEDEVFVRVQSRVDHQPRVITGPVAIAKNPVSHVGDVRRVTAVAGSPLLADNYVNVVVFSARGSRPLPNMLAGSDLDGDQYVCVWDTQLLQPRNSEPMDYSAEPPEEVRQVTVAHLQEHFVNHAINDRLGMIATWLLVHADAEGAASPACQQLAKHHSDAVDFAKTGRPASVGFDLYPHWMENSSKQSYTSEKVLGRIYDRVLAHPLTKQLADAEQLQLQHQRQRQLVQLPAQLLQVPGVGASWQALLADAEQHAALFVRELLGLMNNWGVFDIGELLTSCLARLQRSKSQHHQASEQRDQLQRELRALWTRARRRYLELVLRRVRAAAGSGPGEQQQAATTLQQLELQVAQESCAAADAGAGNVRLQCAAAYLVAAHRWLLVQQQERQLQPTTAMVASRSWDDDTSSVSGSDDEQDEGWQERVLASAAAGGGQAPLQGHVRDDDVEQLAQLCFAWVVVRELEELAMAAAV